MINPQWLELPMSRTNFRSPKDVLRDVFNCLDFFFCWLFFFNELILFIQKDSIPTDVIYKDEIILADQ